jgi:hypothetical protein
MLTVYWMLKVDSCL